MGSNPFVWNLNYDRRPDIQFALNIDRSVMLLNNIVAVRQSETEVLLAMFGRIKRIEQIGKFVL